jgi:heme exporter protein D
MPDLGPHAVFILSAYGVAFVVIAALAYSIFEDDRWQRRALAELERKGIRRRSAPAPEQAESVAGKRPVNKKRARKTPQA